MPPRRGRRVGPWELRQPLGPLGPARRFFARRADDQIAVLLVLKRLPGSRAAEEAWRRYAASPPPPHPGLIPVGDFVDGTRHFALALEPLDCRTLGQWFLDEQPSMGRCLEVFSRLVDATLALHQAGFVHGAIRPDTVLMDRGGQPMLLGAGGLTAPPLGRQGQAGLEQVYQAPELVAGPAPVTPDADVYALGCLLYFLAVGAHPWGSGQASAALLRKKLEPSFDPPLVTSRVPTRALVDVVHRCTRAQARDRAQNAGELMRSLREQELWADGPPDTLGDYAEFFDTGAVPALPVSNADLEALPLDPPPEVGLESDVQGELEAAVVLLRAAPGLAASPHWPPGLRSALLPRLAAELGDLGRRPVVTQPALAQEAADRLPVLAAALRRIEGAITLRALLQGLGEPERLALLGCLIWLEAEGALRLEGAPGFWEEDWS